MAAAAVKNHFFQFFSLKIKYVKNCSLYKKSIIYQIKDEAKINLMVPISKSFKDQTKCYKKKMIFFPVHFELVHARTERLQWRG